MELKKIIILGSSGSGKTKILEYLCENTTKTTAMDYGNTVLEGTKVHFFVPSGKERFGFMQEVLSKNVDGAIIIIDSTNGITEIDLKIMNFIKEKGVSYVIFANKQDIDNKDLNTDSINVPIIPTTAINGGGIDDGLKLLLKLIDENETYIETKTAYGC